LYGKRSIGNENKPENTLYQNGFAGKPHGIDENKSDV
jgi:hypothetical protein